MEVELIKKRPGLLRSTSIFSSMTMLSRILGFIRDMVIAMLFGATPALDAFVVAFRIPNFMRRLFAEGAFSQAFVPILTEYHSKSEHQDVKEFVGKVGGTLASATFLLTIIAIIFAPLIISIFAPGFAFDDSERFYLASNFLRITFPYIFFISLVAFCSAVLNTFGIFGPPAFTPAILNIVLIVFAVFLSKYFAVSTWSLVIGVFVAGLLQLIFLLPFLARIKLLSKLKIAWKDKQVKCVLKAMVPALFGVSVDQISIVIGTVFASFLPLGSISWLYYSDRIMNLPLGVIGVALSTVILPTLSRSYVSENKEQFSSSFDWACRGVLLVSIPASLGLIILSGPILTTLFCYKSFTIYDVEMTRRSLIAFAIGIPAFMMIKVLASSFYAQRDLKTPVKAGIVAVCVTIILNFLLIGKLAHAGLALSTSLSAYVNALILWIMLKRKSIYQKNLTWKKFLFRLTLPNFMVIAWCIYMGKEVSIWQHWAGMTRAFNLFILLIGAIFLYFAMLRTVGFRYRDIKSPAIDN